MDSTWNCPYRFTNGPTTTFPSSPLPLQDPCCTCFHTSLFLSLDKFISCITYLKYLWPPLPSFIPTCWSSTYHDLELVVRFSLSPRWPLPIYFYNQYVVVIKVWIFDIRHIFVWYPPLLDMHPSKNMKSIWPLFSDLIHIPLFAFLNLDSS